MIKSFIYILVGNFLFLGCVKVSNIVNPDIQQVAVHLPPTSYTHFGIPKAYEHKVRADIFIARDKLKDAIKEYSNAIANDPYDSHLRVQFAQTLIEAKQLSRARLQIAKAILLNPANSEAWTTQATIQLQTNETTDAIKSATYAYTVNRNDTLGLLWLARYYENKSDKKSREVAFEYYQRALMRSSNDAQALLDAGHLAINLNYMTLATQYLTQYLKKNRYNPKATLNVAKLHMDQNQYTHAEKLLETSLTLHPANDAIRTELISILLKTKQHRKAQNHILMLKTNANEAHISTQANWLIEAHALWDARELIISHTGTNPSNSRLRIILAKTEALLHRPHVTLALLQHPKGQWPKEMKTEVEFIQSLIKEN